jgi:ABC-2 type transport system ATP-binding protein
MTLLQARNLSKSYSRTVVLRDVSLSAGPGEAVGIIGPNGAGKTTLLRMVIGLIQGVGVVSLGGVPVPGGLARVRVGYFGGESTVPPGVPSRHWRRLFRGVDAGSDSRRARVLSRGTRQLLGLETVLAVPDLELIVLDEPWEGLDPDAARWLSSAIAARREAGACVLVSSHRLHDLAGVCDRYLFLDHGSLTEVATADLAPDGAAVTAEALFAAFDALRRRPPTGSAGSAEDRFSRAQPPAQLAGGATRRGISRMAPGGGRRGGLGGG